MPITVRAETQAQVSSLTHHEVVRNTARNNDALANMEMVAEFRGLDNSEMYSRSLSLDFRSDRIRVYYQYHTLPTHYTADHALPSISCNTFRGIEP
jgi:hypothetical protein